MYLAMKEDWGYKDFTVKEMTCKCGCGLLPRDSFMVLLQLLRNKVDFPIIINSGARCAAYNAKIGSKSIAHSIGAADVRCYGERAFIIIQTAIKFGFTGIGIDQKPSTPIESRYAHLDNLQKDEYLSTPRPRLWSY